MAIAKSNTDKRQAEHLRSEIESLHIKVNKGTAAANSLQLEIESLQSQLKKSEHMLITKTKILE